jgi:cold shock CspA family protein
MNDHPMRGKMIWFNSEKGYGFIRTEDEERLYVARSGFLAEQEPTSRCAGREVTFERIVVDGETRAVGVSFVTVDEAAGRARRRSPRSGSKL